MSGKYRVVRLSDHIGGFESLKRSPTGGFPRLEDGVYVEFDQPQRVELIDSNVDAVDFFVPNGGFNGKRFELISYISGDKAEGDAAKYLAPASELPASETQGHGILDIQGNAFANLPPVPSGYINRSALEEELARVLLDDRHPVVTLTGRGGIGKTSLALTVLHQIANQARFDCILWFSARDIDLLPEGPKLVRPQILTEKDVANEFVRLLEPSEAGAKGFDRVNYLAQALTKSPVGQALLFVFDNFETVRDKIDLFMWLDTYVRPPNKILITTRVRDFKGDYPIEVFGMTEQESDELVNAFSNQLSIAHLLSKQYRKDVYKESDGHPYVIKMLLFEVAKAGSPIRVGRLVAGGEELLNALFERTYAGLAPVAKRVFLTLCNWKSTVARLAVEAVLLRPANDKMDVRAGIEELAQTSFIEISVAKEDNEPFLTVPLVRSVFGKRKLMVSPMKSAIDADTEVLQAFGAAQRSDVRHGLGSRVDRVFREVAQRCSRRQDTLDEYLPILEFISRKYPRGWLLLASLLEEFKPEGGIEDAKESVRRYLESGDTAVSPRVAWKLLANYCRRTSDNSGEIHALVEMCQIGDSPFNDVSYAANRLNQLFQGQYVMDMEKRIVVGQLVAVMEARLEEADATDCSRLAWLQLHLHNEEGAMEAVQAGLRIDPNNDHCQRLFDKLELQLNRSDNPWE